MNYNFIKLALIGLLTSSSVFAQFNFEWSNKIKSSRGGNDYINSVTSDSSGNTIVAGYYEGSINLNNSVGNSSICSNGGIDFYLAKYDTSGNLLWAKSMGGPLKDKAYSVETDAAGNIYLTGTCAYQCDFNGSNAITLISDYAAQGDSLIFLAKYSSQGNLIWVKGMNGTGSGHGKALRIAANGDIVLAGNFSGSIDFDPSLSTTLLVSADTVNSDFFISRYTATGDLIWVKQFGGNQNDLVNGLAMDANENYYITGYFMSTTDFDAGVGVTSYTAPSGIKSFYMAKYDVNCNLVWANYGNNPINGIGNDIVLAPSGEVYVVGNFTGSLTIANAGSTLMLASLSEKTFVLKCTQSDSILWGKALTDHGNFSIAASKSNAIYISGSDKNSLVYQIRLTKLDSAGNISWTQVLGANNIVNEGQDVCVTSKGKVIHVGYFQATVDFNPSTLQTTNLNSKYLSSGFIASYSENNNLDWAIGIKDDSTANFSTPDVLYNDKDGNVYLSGQHQGNLSTDPTLDSLSTTLIPYGYSGFYLAKYGENQQQKWSIDIGGSGFCRSRSISTDNDGNVYVSGNFSLTVDFNPSASTTNLIGLGGKDVFFAKYDSSGSLMWVKHLPGIVGSANSTDELSKIVYRNGRIYLMGNFYGVVDFDPSGGIYQLDAAPYNYAHFFACYNAATGDFIYAKKWRAATSNADSFDDFNITKEGNIVIAGSFWSSLDFDLGSGVALLSAGNGNSAAFVACYDSLLNYKWAVKAVSSGDFTCKRIQTDELGNHYIAGTFSSLATFYSTLGLTSTTGVTGSATYMYIAKYDSLGTLLFANSTHLWPSALSNSNTNRLEDMVLDKKGNIYLSGKLLDNIDFNMGVPIYTLAPFNTSTSDAFIACYNKNGYFNFAKSSFQAGSESNSKLSCTDSSLYVFNSSSEAIGIDADFNNSIHYIAGNNLVKYKLICLEAQNIITAVNSSSCGPGSSQLSVVSSASTIHWYTNDIGGNPFYTGSNYITPLLSASETYYISDPSSVCYNYRIPVTAEIKAFPSTALVNNDPLLTALQVGANYQWLNCQTNSPISGANAATYTAISNGTYAVILDLNGCVDTSACISVTTVGTLEVPKVYVQMYPNPVSDYLKISYSGKDKLLLKLYDCTGQLLNTVHNYQSDSPIDFSSFAKGIYFLEYAVSERTERQVILKQ